MEMVSSERFLGSRWTIVAELGPSCGFLHPHLAAEPEQTASLEWWWSVGGGQAAVWLLGNTCFRQTTTCPGPQSQVASHFFILPCFATSPFSPSKGWISPSSLCSCWESVYFLISFILMILSFWEQLLNAFPSNYFAVLQFYHLFLFLYLLWIPYQYLSLFSCTLISHVHSHNKCQFQEPWFRGPDSPIFFASVQNYNIFSFSLPLSLLFTWVFLFAFQCSFSLCFSLFILSCAFLL